MNKNQILEWASLGDLGENAFILDQYYIIKSVSDSIGSDAEVDYELKYQESV